MIENVTYNSPTNLLNKYTQQKSDNTNTKVSETPNDEVVIKKNNDKKKGSKILKTILGFGSSTVIGGFVGKFLAEKKLPQLDKILSNKEDKIYDEIDKIFLPLNRAKGAYDTLEKIMDNIAWGVDEPECYIFESENKKLADKIINLINKVCGSTFEVINVGTGEHSFDDILKTRKNPNETKLFKLENVEKYLGKEFKEKNGKSLQDILTNTKNKNIYFLHVDKLKQEYGYFTEKININNLKDLDHYMNLLEELANVGNQMRKIDKLKKLNLPAIGIAAGLAVATSIFAILKIKNKGKKNENITTSNK